MSPHKPKIDISNLPESGLVGGYYRVRSRRRWAVVRWKPQAQRWLDSHGMNYEPDHWDEIGEKVA